MKSAMLTVLIAVILTSCMEEKQEIVVVSKKLKKQRETSTAVPDEYSSFAPASSGTSYWVEGTVRNDGATDASNIELVFSCIEGTETRVLVATVKTIAAGKTVPYKTKGYLARYEMKLGEEEPEIVVGM